MKVERWDVIPRMENPSGAESSGQEDARPPSPAPDGTEEFALPFTLKMEDGPPVEITIHLPQAQPALNEILAAEMEDLYVLYGNGGLDALAAGMERMPDVGYVGIWMAEAKRTYKQRWENIQERADDVCKKVQETARRIALERLSASIAEIQREANRYLAGARRPQETVDLSGTHPPAGLKIASEGGETEDLILALVKVRGLRRKLAQALGSYQALLDGTENGPHPFPLAHLRASSSPLQRTFQPEQEVAGAREQITDAQERFVTETALLCLRHPIIHRLHATETLPEGISATVCRLRQQNAAFGQQVTMLTVRDGEELPLVGLAGKVYEVLKDAYDAARGIKQEIEQHPAAVWDYPVLVETALDELDYDWESFESRSAAEKVGKPGAEQWISDAAALAGVGMIAFEPAPPVALVLGAVSLLLTAASLGIQALRNYQQGRAARAALDPSKCIAGEPTWGFFMINVVLMLIAPRVLPKRLLDTWMLVQGAEAAKSLSGRSIDAVGEAFR